MERSLPMDIHYFIIDHLCDDKSALSACTLVCQAWLHPARTYLFDTVQVQAVALKFFLPFLDAHSNVRPYIKTLRLWRNRRPLGYSSVPEDELYTDALITILSHLDGLRKLHLLNMYLEGRGERALSPYPRRFCLEELQIDECYCVSNPEDTLVDIIDCILLFERISSFSLLIKYSDQPTYHVPTSSSWQPPHIVEIDELVVKVNELWWEETAMVLGKLVGRSPGPRALAFRCGNEWSDVRTIGALLGVAGMNVRRFSLDLSWLSLHNETFSPEKVAATLSFADLSSLEEVHFVFFLGKFRKHTEEGWTLSRICAALLATAAPLSTLTTVSLTVEVSDGEPHQLNEKAIDWTYLDESLHGLRALRRVNVLFKCRTDRISPKDDQVLLLTRKGLSSAAAKEMLTVQIKYGCSDIFD